MQAVNVLPRSTGNGLVDNNFSNNINNTLKVFNQKKKKKYTPIQIQVQALSYLPLVIMKLKVYLNSYTIIRHRDLMALLYDSLNKLNRI